MNQPKFKFDDVVQGKEDKHALSFQVTQIQKHKGEYLYSHIGGDWHREDSLELKQEPKKKKLYAYIENKKQVHFVLNEGEDIMSGQFRINPSCVRAPEYDIEYPEAK